MKHMKKFLALALTFILAFSCGVCTFAVEPSDPAAVTGLTAEWNGKILLYGWGMGAKFDSDNVNVSLTYDDRAPEALSEWNAADWSWRVWCTFSNQTDYETTVTVYFRDKSREGMPLTELPQTSFTLLDNHLEMLIDAQRPLEEIKPNKKVTTADGWRIYSVHTFTAEKSGLHLVQQFPCHGDLLLVAEKNYQYISHISSHDSVGLLKGGHLFTDLEAGETYYIISSGYSEEPYQIKVTDNMRETSDLYGWEYLLFWQARIGSGTFGPQYVIPLRNFTFFEALGIVGSNLLTALFFFVTLPLWILFPNKY